MTIRGGLRNGNAKTAKEGESRVLFARAPSPLPNYGLITGFLISVR